MPTQTPPPARIWWSNASFFVSVHLLALAGCYSLPLWKLPVRTLVFTFAVWQLAMFGITIGYHRLWTHRSFQASFCTRLILSILGAAGFQGSIKRFTDDPIHDPYAATRGMLYAHMGWIFFKPRYDRISLVDKEDLENDPIVAFQHKFYVPIAFTIGFILPPYIGHLWGDALGAFIWGGLVVRVLIWHCVFAVNSLAHWHGLQPFTDEDTSKGNLVVALITAGEGNHNFHAFPHDYRAGLAYSAWDPSKWIIALLAFCGSVTNVRRAREQDIQESIEYMRKKGLTPHQHHHQHNPAETEDDETDSREVDGRRPLALPEWTLIQALGYCENVPRRTLIIIGKYFVEISVDFLKEHPGGANILLNYSISPSGLRKDRQRAALRNATWAFYGGLNNHGRGARNRLKEMRVARVASGSEEYTET